MAYTPKKGRKADVKPKPSIEQKIAAEYEQIELERARAAKMRYQRETPKQPLFRYETDFEYGYKILYVNDVPINFVKIPDLKPLKVPKIKSRDDEDAEPRYRFEGRR